MDARTRAKETLPWGRCAWTAALAAVPFVVRGVYSAPAPGQVGVFALATALLAVAAWRSLVPPRGRERVRTVLVRVGVLATAALVVLEAAAVRAGRGEATLFWGAAETSLWRARSAAELVCTVVALLGWYLAHEGEGRAVRLSSACFCVGALWPALFCAVRAAMGLHAGDSGLAMCAASAVTALAFGCVLSWVARPAAGDALQLLCGALAFGVCKALAASDVLSGFGGMHPRWQWWAVFGALVVTAFAAPLLALLARPSEPRHGEKDERAGRERALGLVRERYRVPTREFEVLCGIAEGLTSREIASRMGITESGVSSHRAHLYARLGVRGAEGLGALLVATSEELGREEAARADGSSGGPSRGGRAVLCCLLAAGAVGAGVVVQGLLGGVGPDTRYLCVIWVLAAALVVGASLAVGLPNGGAGGRAEASGPATRVALARIASVALVAQTLCAVLRGGGWLWPLAAAPVVTYLVVAGLSAGERPGELRSVGDFHALFARGVGTVAADAPDVALCAGAALLIARPLERCLGPLALGALAVAHVGSCLAVLSPLWASARSDGGNGATQEELAVGFFMRRGLSELCSEVAYGMAMGWSHEEISRRYCVSLATVRTYGSRLRKRLGVAGPDDLRRLLAAQAPLKDD